MDIKRLEKSLQVTKAEEDQRAEVSKIKPLGSNQVPDSFETGGSHSSGNDSGGSSSAAPEKKAGQITGGILVKQMTSARLGESGIKPAGTSNAKETAGRKDLNQTQQDQADTVNPKVKIEKGDLTAPGATSQGTTVPAGAFSGDARSNLEKNRQAAQDFLAEHNVKVGSGSGTGASSSGSGVDPSHFGKGNGTTQEDLTIDIAGPGPGNPLDGVNKKLSAINYASGMNSLENIATGLQNAGNDTKGNFHIGKNMIAHEGGMGYGSGTYQEGSGVSGGSGRAAKDNPGLNNAVNQTYVSGMHGSEREWGMMAARDGVNPNDYKTDDGYRVQTGKDNTKIITAPDGTKTVIKPDGTTTTVSPDGSTTTKKDGKTIDSSPPLQPGAKDTTEEDYHDPEAQKLKQQVNEVAKHLGLGGMDLGRSHNQRNAPDQGHEGITGVSVEDAHGGVISQFGKDGLIGQPNQETNQAGGGDSNFHGLPGDTVTDPAEGDTYHGVTRNEDVDVSVKTGMEEKADDDEEKKKPAIKTELRQTRIPSDRKVNS